MKIDAGRKNHAVLHAILDAFDEGAIGLPPKPENLNTVNASEVIESLAAELGVVADSVFFKTSSERFAHAVQLAMDLLPRGSRLLDIGNAPGYLAEALHRWGYDVTGLNLNDLYNDQYPDSGCLERFKVIACDIEKQALPYADQSFDGIVFTEVLEHIATKRPEELLPEFRRVLKPGGVVLFSTPNVCNLSNILALATGKNIFWPTKIFYGGTDRHNREWTPVEVRELFESAGFVAEYFYGMNDAANWRLGASEQVVEFLAENKKNHALLRNTIVGAFRLSAKQFE
ncbi:hypothetical protein GCM10027046_27720 [Uliginosibacterium flavum]|uniref:Class I SAM-dependent methyltransferase n=1 Tax=Uliginosibacterium flavum TaxID=1396831 RepID=A0ABV2TJL4_9RHOO